MLQVSYHEDFKGGPTLLFAGGATEIGALAELFRNWNGASINMVERLAASATIVLCNIQEITIERADAGSFLTWRKKEGIWRVSNIDRGRIIGLLESLRTSIGPRHQYLDSGMGQIQIIVSKDEYPTREA